MSVIVDQSTIVLTGTVGDYFGTTASRPPR